MSIQQEAFVTARSREQVLGVVLSDWAAQVAIADAAIYANNRDNADSINLEMDLSQLGGLLLAFPPRVSDEEHKNYIRTCNSTIDLSFGEPAYRTITSEILNASIIQLGATAIFSDQLSLRRIPTRNHGSDEIWFIPTKAVQLIATAK